jgi:hypothetical protein
LNLVLYVWVPLVVCDTIRDGWINAPYVAPPFCPLQITVPGTGVFPSRKVTLQLGIAPPKFCDLIIAPRPNGVATCGGSGGLPGPVVVGAGIIVSAYVLELAVKLLSPL